MIDTRSSARRDTALTVITAVIAVAATVFAAVAAAYLFVL